MACANRPLPRRHTEGPGFPARERRSCKSPFGRNAGICHCMAAHVSIRRCARARRHERTHIRAYACMQEVRVWLPWLFPRATLNVALPPRGPPSPGHCCEYIVGTGPGPRPPCGRAPTRAKKMRMNRNPGDASDTDAHMCASLCVTMAAPGCLTKAHVSDRRTADVYVIGAHAISHVHISVVRAIRPG